MQSKLILTALMLLILSACGSSGGNEDTSSVSTEGKKSHDWVAKSVQEVSGNDVRYQYNKNEAIFIKIPSDKSVHNVPVTYSLRQGKLGSISTSEYCSFKDNTVSFQITEGGETNKVYHCVVAVSSEGNAEYKKIDSALSFQFIPTCEDGFSHDSNYVCQSFKGSVSVKEGKLFYDSNAKHQIKTDEQFLEAERLSYFALAAQKVGTPQYVDLEENKKICEAGSLAVEKYIAKDTKNIYMRFACKPKKEWANKTAQFKLLFKTKTKEGKPADPVAGTPEIKTEYKDMLVNVQIPVKAKSADIHTYAKATKTGVNYCASKEDPKKNCDAGDVGQDGHDKKGVVIGYKADAASGDCYVETYADGTDGKYWERKKDSTEYLYYNPNGAQNQGFVGSDTAYVKQGYMPTSPVVAMKLPTSYEHINQLNKDKHCGKTTWRLPTALEIMNLANFEIKSDGKARVGFMKDFEEDVTNPGVFLTSTFIPTKPVFGDGVPTDMMRYQQPNSKSSGGGLYGSYNVFIQSLTPSGRIRAIAD